MGDLGRTIDALWRIEAPRLIATLARLLRDVGLAEEIAQDAFVAALEQWPEQGIPNNPGAWLVTTSKRKAVDLIRRETTREAKYARLAAEVDPSGSDAVLAAGMPDPEQVVDDPIGDDLLALVFVACHPLLSRDARVALTLRLAAGLTTEQIARAYLAPSATIGQRISRAKRTLAEANVPIEMPQPDELPARLASVLEVIYVVFSEGYAATSGPAVVRRELAAEAMRLGRVLAGLLPHEPEVHGLLALMELQASRFPTRTAPDGTPALLEDQDRSGWDRILIRHGLSALERATALGRPLGPYTLQAAIAARHAVAPTYADTDWSSILALYDALEQVTMSPVVSLNRAVAVLMVDGPQAALDAVDTVADDPRLRRYHLLGAVRGDILTRLGRHVEAAAELDRAAALAPTPHERRLLSTRAAEASART